MTTARSTPTPCRTRTRPLPAVRVTVGDAGKTVDKGGEITVGEVTVTLRKADRGDHYAELHVNR
ncbi:hypothetical protein ACH4E7_07645 [Kitasatospora sp. NPDC018058]|uniref:hypothetical protein n=1 Tax=Kitasatospora sp. NPDC018058 TaxID=3364025 RepID=UPI0037BE6F03